MNGIEMMMKSLGIPPELVGQLPQIVQGIQSAVAETLATQKRIETKIDQIIASMPVKEGLNAGNNSNSVPAGTGLAAG